MTSTAKIVMAAAGALAVIAAILNGAAVLSNAGNAHPGGTGATATPAPTHTPGASADPGPPNAPPAAPGRVPPGTTRQVKAYCLATVPQNTSQVCLHITHVQVLIDAVDVSTDLPGGPGSADADTAKTIAGATAGWAAANVHTTAGTGGKATIRNTNGDVLADTPWT